MYCHTLHLSYPPWTQNTVKEANCQGTSNQTGKIGYFLVLGIYTNFYFFPLTMSNFIDLTAHFGLLSFWATEEETQAFFHLALDKYYGYTPGIDISI